MSTIALRAQAANAHVAETPAPAIEDQTVAEAPIDMGNWITLRRSGKSPYRFKGETLVESNGYYPGSRLWHEINLHKNSKEDFVLDLRVFKKSSADKDVFHVATFSTMDEVCDFLEGYDPSSDVKIDFDSGDDSLSTSELTLRAVSLRQATTEARRDYQALIGDLLYQLNNAPFAS